MSDEVSVRPDINEPFANTTMTVEDFLNRFEVESRDIYEHRQALVDLVGIKEGDVVADIGCGTGLFMDPVSKAVGKTGSLYCFDTAEKFLAYLEQRRSNLSPDLKIHIGLSGHTSIPLPDNTLDSILMIDVYHHVEFPSKFIPECARVLKPGGFVYVVDFERIEAGEHHGHAHVHGHAHGHDHAHGHSHGHKHHAGPSSEWVLGHVRLSKEQAFKEWQEFNFTIEEITEQPLTDNWIAKFFVAK